MCDTRHAETDTVKPLHGTGWFKSYSGSFLRTKMLSMLFCMHACKDYIGCRCLRMCHISDTVTMFFFFAWNSAGLQYLFPGKFIVRARCVLPRPSTICARGGSFIRVEQSLCGTRILLAAIRYDDRSCCGHVARFHEHPHQGLPNDPGL